MTVTTTALGVFYEPIDYEPIDMAPRKRSNQRNLKPELNIKKAQNRKKFCVF
jgi:hypothetical protein